MKTFTKQFKNARAVIEQLNNNEWIFDFNSLSEHCCRANRKERELWVANGAFFCDVDEKNCFGLIFRHYVWWAAARAKTRAANKKFRGELDDKIPVLYESGD